MAKGKKKGKKSKKSKKSTKEKAPEEGPLFRIKSYSESNTSDGSCQTHHECSLRVS